jgi:hypothetical protein
LQYESDFVIVNLLESAGFNKGASKVYDRVAGNLLSFAAKTSLQKFEGDLLLVAKSALLTVYSSKYGFRQIGSSLRMVSYPENSRKLVSLFYEEDN